MPTAKEQDAKAHAVRDAVMRELDGPVARRAIGVLRELLIDRVRSHGYDRPTGSRVQRLGGQQESLGLPGSEHEFSVREDVRKHLADAIARPSPFGDPCEHAAPSLQAAVDYVASFAGDADAIHNDRQARRAAVDRLGSSAAMIACEARIRALACPEYRRICPSSARPALVYAMLAAAGIPDVEFVADQLAGFPVVGDYPDSGWFRAKDQQATRDFDSMDHGGQADAVEASLRRKSRSLDPNALEELRKCTAKTKKELLKGHAYGGPDMQGLTREEVDARLGRNMWHALLRFAVFQGYDENGDEKWRVCDNARTSHTNECLGVHETLALEEATFPALVAALFARAWGEPAFPLQHATDDVEAAYRRMACRHTGATVVAFFNTDVGDVRYVVMDGHNFGLKSAVLSWNRHAQLAAELARRFYGVCNGGYFDDHDITEPTYAGRTGKVALREVYDWIGVPLSEGDKDVQFGTSNPFLGVISDFSRFLAGKVVMRSKPSRIARLVCDAREYLARDEMSREEAATFCGKMEWTATSAGANRLGRAALSALRMHAKARTRAVREERWPQAREALRFMEAVLPCLPPRTIDISRAAKRPPLVLYTDAMYTGKRTRGGQERAAIGVVIYDPEKVGFKGVDGEGMQCSGTGYAHASAEVPAELLEEWGDRKTKIMQAEVLAPRVAMASKPSWFKDREFVCYVDNTAALCSYAKASSSDVASARMVHEFHALCHMLGARAWFSWVPSKSNIADLPSRNEFSLLQELGSDSFEAAIPSCGAGWEDVIFEAKILARVNLRTRERRWLKETNDAIAAEAWRRAARAAGIAGS